MNRRGFLFGAVALPSGVMIPQVLAKELAMPAEDTPATPESRFAYEDFLRCPVLDIGHMYSKDYPILVLNHGEVFGEFRARELSTMANANGQIEIEFSLIGTHPNRTGRLGYHGMVVESFHGGA